MCSDQYLQSIQPMWASFDAPPYINHVIIAVFHSLILLVGCLGNMFVVCVVFRRPSNLLLLNLAISDFIMVFKSITIVINSIFTGPVLGVVGCQFYGFATGATGLASIMTLAVIAENRSRAICRPLDLTHQLTRRQAYSKVGSTWAYGLVLSCLPLLGMAGVRYSPEGYMTSCSFDYISDSIANKVFILAFFAAAWIMPCLRICRSYYR
ncbi:opsin-2-like [Pollicipes pollicipes]|uniref:opsin-2-like n=1 Tax=Pollicipes pollicipes TaxID=41117 RepID=UPI0018853A4B|nr:opsin-2-like [Pollicipes pollicipes]